VVFSLSRLALNDQPSLYSAATLNANLFTAKFASALNLIDAVRSTASFIFFNSMFVSPDDKRSGLLASLGVISKLSQ